MEFEHKTTPSAADSLPQQEPMKQAKIAAAREQRRVEHEAATTVRNCLGCEGEFRSEGIHNRLCRRCQTRR